MEEFAPGVVSILKPYLKDIERTLCSYDWPGNVRELENFVRMMIAFLEQGDNADVIIERICDSIGKKLLRLQGGGNPPISPQTQEPEYVMPNGFFYNQMQEIQWALKACHGNYTKAAQMLGIHRVTLWRKMKQYEELAHLNKKEP